MSLNEVRDYMMKHLRELADSDLEPDERKGMVIRARAAQRVANTIVDTVKVEVQAAKLFADTGCLVRGVDPPLQERKPFDGKPR